MEFVLVLYILVDGGFGLIFEFNKVGDWVVYDAADLSVLGNEVAGIAALYSYGSWLVIITGWSLLMGVVIILEITRGN